MKKSELSKPFLIGLLIQKMEDESHIISASVANAIDGATNPESKPEGKYDTRALEASYLAGAQQERLRELKASINFIKMQRAQDLSPDSIIAAPALVELENSDGETRHVLLVVAGGGVTIDKGAMKVHVVTPGSPMGSAIIGRKQGDFVMWGPSQAEWKIRSCC